MRVRVGVALLLVVVAAAAVNYLRPIPSVAPVHLLKATGVVPGDAPSLPWPARGSAAVGVAGLGFIATSGNERAIPAASVTKVMTAMVLLTDKPLSQGQSGPTVTLTDADVQSYESDLAQKQSTARVEAGEQLTERQLLQGMLIPSANNLAETAARWDAGSIASFVAKMNARATSLGMTHTKFADVSGASALSVSTPSDLLVLGMEAMKNQAFAEIVAMPQADLPVAGTVYNVDGVLGESGIIGVKTGSGLDAGANFLFAATATIDGREITLHGCVMGQPTLDAAFAAAKRLIAAMTANLHVRRVISRNESIARYTTPWGNVSDLVSSADVDLVEWPGMVFRQRLDAKSLTVEEPVPVSTVEGSEHVVLGDYDLDVPLVTADPLYPPGRVWRLTRVAF
ncbi:MAG TPA: D-alanyl-D-alanine carboxypeptidase [Candidatus Dormibacteraeota bacterium]|jgi:D-alanyl-D-alanine carboxypeptidase (penicillin-binding protein 5/6)